jgi:hypothetical protein
MLRILCESIKEQDSELQEELATRAVDTLASLKMVCARLKTLDPKRGRLNSEIDCDLTLQVPSTGLDRTKKFLDANLYQVQIHVINTVFRNIQTMEKRIAFNDNLFEDSSQQLNGCDGCVSYL